MRLLKKIMVGILVLFVGIQFVPFGRDHSNPRVAQEPAWDSPQTRDLAKRGCFDCHSNETVWPWYSHVAPVSWIVQFHVDEGRSELNFSEWNRIQKEAHEAVKMVKKGEMPMPPYVKLHPEAAFTEQEKAALVAGLKNTVGTTEGKQNAERSDQDLAAPTEPGVAPPTEAEADHDDDD
jgi:mono/diheme cytochrome c family protein